MHAAHMTLEEEVLKLRTECRVLRQANARLEIRNQHLLRTIEKLQKDNTALKAENLLLKQNNVLLLETHREQEKKLESLTLIVEELRQMVFGKKKQVKQAEDNNSGESGQQETSGASYAKTAGRKAANRSKASYRRAEPNASEVTQTHEHPLTHCPDCGMLLIRLKQIMRYVEDIVDLTQLFRVIKTIEKHIMTSGYCPRCKKRTSERPISPQISVLGGNVKKLIAYLVVIMRLSFEQVRSLLNDMAAFDISDGEIVESLDEQAEQLIPERDRLFTRIRGAPGRHYDETVWKTRGGQGDYAWITRPSSGEEAVFLFGRSRGKGNALELRGAVDNQVGISDDYGAYQHLFAKHQLCMAHPHRKLRDLAESVYLTGERKATCVESFRTFSALYTELNGTLASEYQQTIWRQKREAYLIRIKQIARLTPHDPEKLKEIKKGLARNAEKYFTCLLQPGIAADNNKAERGGRHLVLKRKISYGSKSQKGADTLAILCSTLLSCWWSKPPNFFAAYEQMLTP